MLLTELYAAFFYFVIAAKITAEAEATFKDSALPFWGIVIL